MASCRPRSARRSSPGCPSPPLLTPPEPLERTPASSRATLIKNADRRGPRESPTGRHRAPGFSVRDPSFRDRDISRQPVRPQPSPGGGGRYRRGQRSGRAACEAASWSRFSTDILTIQRRGRPISARPRRRSVIPKASHRLAHVRARLRRIACSSRRWPSAQRHPRPHRGERGVSVGRPPGSRYFPRLCGPSPPREQSQTYAEFVSRVRFSSRS